MLIKRINDGPQSPVIGSLGTGATIAEVATIHTPGAMRVTNNTLDVAVEGDGYFAVETPNGLRYTRNGTFHRSVQGELVTSDGFRVMGQAGPILLDDGKVNISEDGRIQVDGEEVDQLRLTGFANEQALTKEGDSLMVAGEDAQMRAATGLVRQGALEMPNVNVVLEMVHMITGYRAYEVNSKAVQAHDQLLDKAVNQVGSV